MSLLDSILKSVSFISSFLAKLTRDLEIYFKLSIRILGRSTRYYNRLINSFSKEFNRFSIFL